MLRTFEMVMLDVENTCYNNKLNLKRVVLAREHSYFIYHL
jgi:hypothetical protein